MVDLWKRVLKRTREQQLSKARQSKSMAEPMDIEVDARNGSVQVYSNSNFEPFALVPPEIRNHIFSFLDYKGVGRAARVCKKWHEECDREKVWKLQCLSLSSLEFNDKSEPPKGKNWKWVLRSRVVIFSANESMKEGVGTYNHTPHNYTGDWKNNKKHGYGALIYDGGDRYEGEFSEDERHGHGKFVVAKTGSSYEGSWEKDVRHGFGVYKWSNGDVYRGHFVKHNREGYGVYEWPTNDRYEGQFLDNAKHGFGVFYFNNGDVFEGNYLKGKRSGKGVYKWPHGDRFEGTYDDDVRKGFGTYFYSYGGRYEGLYENDKRHGAGAFIWPDGDRYEGTWENESRRGPGKLYCKDGRIFTLQWNEVDDANYAYSIPDKFPTPTNSRS